MVLDGCRELREGGRGTEGELEFVLEVSVLEWVGERIPQQLC